MRINLEELLYVESEGNYLTFQETDRKTLSRMTIGEAMEKIERHQLTIGKVQVPLSGSYRNKLLEQLKVFSGDQP